MKKIVLTCVLLSFALSANAIVSEFFPGKDVNSVRAGISKYILSRGGKISNSKDYKSNTFQAVEQVNTRYGQCTYIYTFKLAPASNGTQLNMDIKKTLSGSNISSANIEDEQIIVKNIKNSINGRLLYGLDFEWEYYDTENGKVKAPKGKNSGGIKLTGTKYDAMKKGLKAGDIITEINGTPVEDIPMSEYAIILQASSVSDVLFLTCKRGNEIFKVTIAPRPSNARVF